MPGAQVAGEYGVVVSRHEWLWGVGVLGAQGVGIRVQGSRGR